MRERSADPPREQQRQDVEEPAHGRGTDVERDRARRAITAAEERVRALPPPGAFTLADDGRANEGVAEKRESRAPEAARGREPQALDWRTEVIPPPTRRAVRALDAGDHVVAREEPTQRAVREQDIATTEPDVVNSALERARDAAIAEASKRDGRALRLVSEGPTRPTTDSAKSSDVFAPEGAAERVIDPEGATPLDRPVKKLIDERPTDLGHSRATTTATFHGTPRTADNLRRPIVTDRWTRDKENERERALVKAVYETEHSFYAMQNTDRARADHVLRLRDELKDSGAFNSRELVLALHARDKRALDTPGRDTEKARDRVMALGLIARELDDKYRHEMRALEKIVREQFEQLRDDKREEVYADFDSFTEDNRSNDSSYCRKELHRALRDETEYHRAYIYALALERQRRARESAESDALKRSSKSSSRSRP